jgi:hypothetical protein
MAVALFVLASHRAAAAADRLSGAGRAGPTSPRELRSAGGRRRPQPSAAATGGGGGGGAGLTAAALQGAGAGHSSGKPRALHGRARTRPVAGGGHARDAPPASGDAAVGEASQRRAACGAAAAGGGGGAAAAAAEEGGAAGPGAARGEAKGGLAQRRGASVHESCNPGLGAGPPRGTSTQGTRTQCNRP